MVNSAKALLLSENIKTNTQSSIISQFDEDFVQNNKIKLETSFSELIYQIREYAPSASFSEAYIHNAVSFLNVVRAYREQQQKLVKL